MSLLLALFLTGAPDSLPPARDSASAVAKPVLDSTGVGPVTESLPEIPPESTGVVYYGGKRIVFDPKEAKVYLMDSAWVRYLDMYLASDSIIYDIKKSLLSSYKLSRFRTATDSVDGTELHYNVDTRKGYVTKTTTAVDQGYLRADDLWMVRSKVMDVNDGSYTTCDRNPPHYTFWGKRIRVLIDDMVIVEPLVLKIGRVPVIAAPFWFFPISKKRKSGLLPISVGQSATEGFYAKNVAYYWAINEYSDATFTLNAMTKSGLLWSGEGVYAVGPYASGQLDASYLNQINGTLPPTQRYSIAGQHSGRFLFGTRIDARADFMSDNSFTSDYSDNQIQWLKSELESFVNISRSFKNIGSGNISARRHVDFQSHLTEVDFPSLGMSFSSIPLPLGMNLNSSVNLTNSTTDQWTALLTDTTSGDTDTVREAHRTFRLSPGVSLSLPPSLLGGLTLSPNVSYSQDSSVVETLSTGRLHATSSRQVGAGSGLGFSQNLGGIVGISEGVNYGQTVNLYPESTHTDAAYSLSASGHTALYKIYPLSWFGLHGMLHKVSPNVSYSLTPRTLSRGLFGTPRFDTTPATSQLGLSLGNDFQAKVGDSMQKRDIGHLNFSTGLNLVSPSLPDIGADLDLVLIDAIHTQLEVTGNAGFSTSQSRLSSYSVTTHFSHEIVIRDSAAHLDRRFAVGLQHYLSRDQDMLNADIKAMPKGWSFALTGGWNIKTGAITDYKLDVIKDLHCWEVWAEVAKLGDRWSYDFKVRIKAIPDVGIGKSLFSWMLP